MLDAEPINLDPGDDPIPKAQYEPTTGNLETLDKGISTSLPEDWDFGSKKGLYANYGIDTRRGFPFSGPTISISPTENNSHQISVRMGNKYVTYVKDKEGKLSLLDKDSVAFPIEDSNLWNEWCTNTISKSLQVAQNKGLLSWRVKES